jgi:hypothetical protein
MGVEHPPQPQRFKTYALGGHIAQEASPYGVVDFVGEESLVSGSTGCTDVGITEYIEPGRSVDDTLWWSGYAAPNRAVLPGGPLEISIGAGYYWRGDVEPDRIADQEFELSLDAWVDNPDADQLSPALIVDAALGDPQFAAYVDTQAIADGRAEIAWYDADRNVWEVGIMPWYETDPPRIHGVVVDGSTGAIVGPLDRAWDRATDPFP